MSLVHNYGTWTGLRSLDRASMRTRTPLVMSAMASGTAENAAHARAGHSGALVPMRRGVKFSRPFYAKVCKPLAMSLGSGDHSLGLLRITQRWSTPSRFRGKTTAVYCAEGFF